jgi:hypothetical protein
MSSLNSKREMVGDNMCKFSSYVTGWGEKSDMRKQFILYKDARILNYNCAPVIQ